MADPETRPDEIALEAAEAAADVTEAERPQDRQRLAAAFTKAASSGARRRPRHPGGTARGRRGATRGRRGHRLAGHAGHGDGAAPASA
jgi:hypothetical protein